MIRYTKWAIWLYIILLLFEGALRKWVVPSLSTPLLIVRDPVLLLIYALALAAGIVPRTKFMLVLAVMAGASFCFAFLAGQNNLYVTLYGLRTNYLHVPLIWVMAEAFKRKDVEYVGIFFLFMAIVMGVVMGLQFDAPIDSWINRGIGEDEMGQIYGAAGHIRAPGLFTFITGPMVFFPLATAFFLNAINSKTQNTWRTILLIVSGFSITLAVPGSISRGTAIGTLLVVVVYLLASLKIGILNPSFLRFCAIGLVLVGALYLTPKFREHIDAFMDRWDTAAAEVEGKAVGSLVGRVLGGFTQPLDTIERTPLFGYGIGVGTNAGAAMLAGKTGFLLAEDEWGRIIMELGPILGLFFVGFRFALVFYLGVLSVRALWHDKDILPILIFSAAAWVILINQWGQPTQLGFAVVGGGLLMAALNRDEEEDDETEEDDEDAEDFVDDGSDDEDDSEEDDEPEKPAEEISAHEARRRRLRGL